MDLLAAARFDSTPCPVPSWLPGGDAQTVYAALFAQYHRIAFVRDRVETPDTDFVDFDWTGPGPVSYTHLTLPTILLV